MSVISAIRSQFAIGQQHNSTFDAQRGSAAKMSMSRGAGGDVDEVSYAALNDSDTNFDISMMEDSLNYEAYKAMEESDDKEL